MNIKNILLESCSNSDPINFWRKNYKNISENILKNVPDKPRSKIIRNVQDKVRNNVAGNIWDRFTKNSGNVSKTQLNNAYNILESI